MPVRCGERLLSCASFRGPRPKTSRVPAWVVSTSARGAAIFSSGGERGATSANGAAVAAVPEDAPGASTAGKDTSAARGGGASRAVLYTAIDECDWKTVFATLSSRAR